MEFLAALASAPMGQAASGSKMLSIPGAGGKEKGGPHRSEPAWEVDQLASGRRSVSNIEKAEQALLERTGRAALADLRVAEGLME